MNMNIFERYKKGEFRTSTQIWLPDGSVLLILFEPSGTEAHVVKVKDLWKPSEKVIDAKTVPVEDLINIDENIKAMKGY
jgi:hypothetical protein